jgi:GTPase SAR1 family protein
VTLNRDLPRQFLATPAVRENIEAHLDKWLQKTLNIVESMPLEDVGAKMGAIASLKSLEERQLSPEFRLAMVGEFSRGKSCLINRLLEREELLPVSAAPTAAILTSVVAGTQEQIVVSSEANSQEVRSLSPTVWDEILATQENIDEGEISTRVSITVDEAWLRALDVELIDTPGAGDLSEQRAAVVFDLLSQCDAAVLVISATSPFSLTEAAFLEQEVIGRHIPRVIVMVTKLDTIALAERKSVLATIRERVAQVSSAIQVLPTYPLDDSTTEAEILADLKTRIAELVAPEERRQCRNQQVAAQLADCLSKVETIGEAAIASIRLSCPEREQAVLQAQDRLLQAKLKWENLHLELERQRLECEQTLKQKISYAKTQLVEVLKLELSQTAQPKTWWEKELPMRLRRELITLARKSESWLVETISKDFVWLRSEIARLFSVSAPELNKPSLEQIDMTFVMTQLKLSNTGRDRLFSKIGSSAAAVCGYVLAGPVAIVVGTSVWLVSERIIKRQTQIQRQLLAEELQRTVDFTFAEYANAACKRLQELYSDLAQDIYKQQSAWQTTITTALATGSSEDEKAWQQLTDRAIVLKQEITAALGKRVESKEPIRLGVGG